MSLERKDTQPQKTTRKVSISFGDLMSLEPRIEIETIDGTRVSISFGDLMSLEPEILLIQRL